MSASLSAKTPLVIVVGGFLGAGKTTLLLAAAKELESRGLRGALVLNDQGHALVDSKYASSKGLQRGEVTGGCFCCRFSELVDVIEELKSFAPDVIFAEPVGSCTDISATTLQPLRELSDRLKLAPFTVLVDPARAIELLEENADSNLKFLFAKQLQEADLVCFTKSDLRNDYPDLKQFGVHELGRICAKTGVGVAAWLDEMLFGLQPVGSRILEIDYEQYAQAEAALAWLNLRVDMNVKVAQSPATVLGPLLEKLDLDLTRAKFSIVHLKAIMSASTGYIKAAITGNGQAPEVEGNLDASPSFKHSLLLNLRAIGPAPEIQEIMELSLLSSGAELDNLEIACFHPAAPQPEHRYAVRID